MVSRKGSGFSVAAHVAWLLLFCLAQNAAASDGVQRVVSIGGSTTEIVYTLGAGDSLVAVDSTSLYPAEASGLANVGYMRQLGAEPILALQPSLVLAEADSGPPAVLDQLRSAGVNLVIVPDDHSPAGVLEKIGIVSAAVGKEAEGQALTAKLQGEFAHLEKRVSTIGRRPKVLFLLSVGQSHSTPLAAGRGTSAAGIVALAGGENAVDDFEGFRPMSSEAIVAAAPDVVLVTHRTVELFGGRDKVLAHPGLAETPAGRNRRLVTMDGLLLLGFGPRTPQAIRELAGALHPGFSLSSAD